MALQRVKQFKDLELSYDSVSTMTVVFSTDMPGGSMSTRATLTFPASTGRKTHTLPLDGIEGTLFKVKISSAGVVRLFGGIVRVRPISVYFDGASTPAEIWESQEQGVGI
jgi:hypothetical protein